MRPLARQRRWADFALLAALLVASGARFAVAQPPLPSPPLPPIATQWCSSSYAVACYDARYYVSGSSTWPDLSGNGRNLTFYFATQTSSWATVVPWTPSVTTVRENAASGVYFYGYPAGGTANGHYASLGSGSFPLQGAGNSFTFMAWIYPNATNGPPVLWTLNRYNDGTGAGTTNIAMQQLPCFSDLTASGVQGFGNGAGIPGSSSSCTTALPLNNAWTHLAFVRNGLSGSYYINGALNSTQTAPNNVTYGTGNFTIGCDFRNMIYGTANPRCFTGFIGSMTFLNTALSSSDILQAYAGTGPNAAFSPPAPPPPRPPPQSPESPVDPFAPQTPGAPPSPPPSLSPPPRPPPMSFSCCTGSGCSGGVSNDPVACAALGDFYFATSGESWRNATGWATAAVGVSTDYCTFHGVFCSGGVVTELCVLRMILCHTCVC